MPLLLEVTEPLTLDLLTQAWRHLVAYHDMLRARFVAAPDGWRQTVVAAVAPHDIQIVTHETAWKTAVTTAQQSLNLAEGPLLRPVYWQRNDDRPDLLFLAAHHLIMDGVSWRILLSDWQTLYRQLKQGEPPQLPLPTTSYRQWGKKLLALCPNGRRPG
jgi:NRPS condensation-like uncharacterized protein